MENKKYVNICWNCYASIDSLFNVRCNICGWYICNICGACSKSCSKSEDRIEEIKIKKIREAEEKRAQIKAEQERINRENKAIHINSLEQFIVAVFLLYELEKMKVGVHFLEISKNQIEEFRNIYHMVSDKTANDFSLWLKKHYRTEIISDSFMAELWNNVQKNQNLDFYDFLYKVGMEENFECAYKFVKVRGMDGLRRTVFLDIIEETENGEYIKLMKVFESFIFNKEFEKCENEYVKVLHKYDSYFSSYDSYFNIYEKNKVYLKGHSSFSDFKLNRENRYPLVYDTKEYSNYTETMCLGIGMYKVVQRYNPHHLDYIDDYRVDFGTYFTRYSSQERKKKRIEKWNKQNAKILNSYLPVKKNGKQWEHCIALETETSLVPFDIKKNIDAEYALSDIGYYIKDADGGYSIRPTTLDGREKFVSGKGYIHNGEKEYQKFLKAATKYVDKCKKKGEFPNKEFMEYIFGVKVN